MSNLNEIIRTAGSSNIKTFGNGLYLNNVMSAPLSGLFKPLNEFQIALADRQAGYDALALGMSSLDEVISNSYYNDSEQVTNITLEQGLIVTGAIRQAKQLLAEDSELLVLTSASGLCYSLQIDGVDTDDDSASRPTISCINADLIPVKVMWYDEPSGSYRVLNTWPSSVSTYNPFSDISHDDVTSLLQRICNFEDVIPASGSNYDMMAAVMAKEGLPYPDHQSSVNVLRMAGDLCDHFSLDDTGTLRERLLRIAKYLGADFQPTTVGDSTEPVINIVSGLLESGTLNAAIIETIDALKTSRFSSWINTQLQLMSTMKASVKRFFRNVGQAFSQGGIKGVIRYIYQIIKTGHSVTSDEGLLIFTDNQALLPKQYIVGLISQIVSAVASVVGAIVSFFAPFIGVIVSLLGTLAYGIFGSIKSDVASTRAAMFCADNEEQQLSCVSCCPIAVLRGEANISVIPWYKNFYANTGRCAIMDVPGGSIILGPGSFSSNQEITTVRYEFHPSTSVIKPGALASHFGLGFYLGSSSQPTAGVWDPDNVDASSIYSYWKDIMEHDYNYQTMVNSVSTGSLSEDDDELLRDVVCGYIVLFCSWMCYKDNSSLPSATLLVRFGTSVAVNKLLDAGCGVLCNHSADTRVHCSWSDIVTACNDLNDASVDEMIIWKVDQSSTTYGFDTTGFHVSAALGLVDEENPNFSIIYGSPVTLPDELWYGIIMPKYDSRSFWTWVAATAIVAAAVTVTTVVCTIKFSKWRKFKRAANVARANDAQSTYQDAVNGVKTVVDPQTGEIHQIAFDQNTTEGKAYVQQCFKDYKKVVRTNNMMANIVGGTRYDATTFYGDSDTEDGGSKASLPETIKSNAIFSLYNDNDAVLDEESPSSIIDGSGVISAMRLLIVGK